MSTSITSSFNASKSMQSSIARRISLRVESFFGYSLTSAREVSPWTPRRFLRPSCTGFMNFFAATAPGQVCV